MYVHTCTPYMYTYFSQDTGTYRSYLGVVHTYQIQHVVCTPPLKFDFNFLFICHVVLKDATILMCPWY